MSRSRLDRSLRTTDISKIIVSVNAHRRALPVARDERLALRLFRRVDRNGRFNVICDKSNVKSNDERDYDNAEASRFDPRNSVFFAFGDFEMCNCEDGYVLSDRGRVTTDSVYCRRVILNGRGTVSLATVMSIELNQYHSARLHVGTLLCDRDVNISNGGGVMSYRRRRRLRRDVDRWETGDEGYEDSAVVVVSPSSSLSSSPSSHRDDIVDLYVVWQSAFLCDSRNGARPGTHTSISGESRNGGGSYSETRVYSSECSIRRASVDVESRCLTIRMFAPDTRQILKLQNSYGQKGVARYANLSEYETVTGTSLDLVASVYSQLGRQAAGQLLEQRRTLEPVVSRRTGRVIGMGGYGLFFFSDDSPHVNFIYSAGCDGENPMRMCRLTYDSLLENDVSSAAFVKTAEFNSQATHTPV